MQQPPSLQPRLAESRQNTLIIADEEPSVDVWPVDFDHPELLSVQLPPAQLPRPIAEDGRTPLPLSQLVEQHLDLISTVRYLPTRLGGRCQWKVAYQLR